MTLRPLLASALIAAFLAYVWAIRGELVSAFANLSAENLVGLFGLLLVHWIVRAWRDRLLYSAAGHRLGVMSIFWLNTLQLSLNYLPAKAGTLSSVEFFRSKLGVPFQEFALVLAQQYLMTVLASSMLAAAALWLFSDASLPGRAAMVLTLTGICGICFGLLWWDGFARLLPRAAARKLDGWVRKLAVFRSSRRHAVGALALSLAMCMFAGLRMAVVYGVLALELGLPEALVISASMQLSAIVSITPAGIGITESVVAVSSVLVRHTVRDGIIAATMDRAVILALSIGLGLLWVPFAWKRKRKPIPTDSTDRRSTR